MEENRIRPIDDVRIEVRDEKGREVDVYQGSGYNTVEQAVMAAYESSARMPLDIRDYVFTVRNLTTDTTPTTTCASCPRNAPERVRRQPLPGCRAMRPPA